MITGPGERPLELCWYSHGSPNPDPVAETRATTGRLEVFRMGAATVPRARGYWKWRKGSLGTTGAGAGDLGCDRLRVEILRRRRMSTSVMANAVACAGLLAILAVGCAGGGEQGQAAEEGTLPGEGFAAIPGLTGGQDIFGPYEVVPDWPRPMSESLPGHEQWTYSVTMDVFAESPNRVLVASKGELPLIEKRPESIWLPQLGPGLQFPVFRLPLRQAGGGVPERRSVGPTRKWPAGHRLALRAQHPGDERRRQDHRRLDAVGQDVDASARHRDQPLRLRRSTSGSSMPKDTASTSSRTTARSSC